MNGLFITFEGLEGSGKSTQVGLLASKLREEARLPASTKLQRGELARQGKEIVVTREPGGTRIGEQIRDITHNKDNVDLTAVTEAYLMAASRAQHIREIIRPALEAGKIVISDRYIDSSLAYQGYGRELGVAVIEQLNQFAVDSVMPNLTILLDVPLEIGFSRRNGSNKIDRLDLQQKDFYKRVYQGYKHLAEKYKERFVVIDSSSPIEEVHATILRAVSSFSTHH